MRRGFTLVECMLASAILGFLALALFEGVIVATRIAHENSELLAAEAVAWDAVWKRFNEDYEKLRAGRVEADLTPQEAPQLAVDGYAAATLSVTVGLTDEAGFSRSAEDLMKITADVEWGPAGRRRTLSSEGHAPSVFRSRLGRAN